MFWILYKLPWTVLSSWIYPYLEDDGEKLSSNIWVVKSISDFNSLLSLFLRQSSKSCCLSLTSIFYWRIELSWSLIFFCSILSSLGLWYFTFFEEFKNISLWSSIYEEITVAFCESWGNYYCLYATDLCLETISSSESLCEKCCWFCGETIFRLRSFCGLMKLSFVKTG